MSFLVITLILALAVLLILHYINVLLQGQLLIWLKKHDVKIILMLAAIWLVVDNLLGV